MADDIKIDWNKVKKDSDETKIKTEERIISEEPKQKNEINVKQSKSQDIQTKFKKHKLRPINFVVWLLTLVFGAFISIVVCYATGNTIVSVLSGTGNLGQLFDEKISVFTLGLSSLFGILIYALIACLFGILIYVSFVCVFYTIRNLINIGRLNFACDEDYTKNVLIYKSLIRTFWLAFISVLGYFYYAMVINNTKTASNLTKIISIFMIISIVVFIVCSLLLITDLIVAKKKYMKNTPQEQYYPVMLEKKRILKQYLWKKAKNRGQIGLGKKRGLY